MKITNTLLILFPSLFILAGCVRTSQRMDQGSGFKLHKIPDSEQHLIKNLKSVGQAVGCLYDKYEVSFGHFVMLLPSEGASDVGGGNDDPLAPPSQSKNVESKPFWDSLIMKLALQANTHAPKASFVGVSKWAHSRKVLKKRCCVNCPNSPAYGMSPTTPAVRIPITPDRWPVCSRSGCFLTSSRTGRSADCPLMRSRRTGLRYPPR